jgi:hypothetical protein
MRDILVTPDNAGRQEMFSFAHIERMAALRKLRRGRKTAARPLQAPWLHPLTGAIGCSRQQPDLPADLQEMKDS